MIKTTYNLGGELIVRPEGYPGQTCRNATAPYEENRGGTRQSRDVEPTIVEELPQEQRTGQ